jgi:peptide deformylase
MAVLPILQLGAPELRRKAVEVTRFDRALGRLIDDMIDTMRAAPGVGLAANQVGRPERVCVIEIEGHLWELVNPVMLRTDGVQDDYEGCLSLAGYYAPTPRAMSASLEARDRHGKKLKLKGKGFLARAMQHEVGHLDGGLYIDLIESMDLLERPGDDLDDEADED